MERWVQSRINQIQVKKLFLSAVIFFSCSSTALSQGNTPSDQHFVELGYQAGSLLEHYASFQNISIGRTLFDKYSVGLVFHTIVSDYSSSNLKRINFWYIGPQLTHTLYSKGLLHYYIGSTVCVGNFNSSNKSIDTVISGGGVIPELGIKYKFADYFNLDLGASIFHGMGGDFKAITIPLIKLGMQFIY